jgi:hypothetical protein
MDRNNPVWREYLKAVIRLQIDAGVDGIQLDEAELPITTFQYGGCFCKDCMKGFRSYLKALPEGALPVELRETDLDRFHYGEWLLARGYDFKQDREETPLFWDYTRYQLRAIERYFAELADYAREYAAQRGRPILVSGNFFNLVAHWYYPMEPKVDLIITEMRNTRYRQPAWYRYVAGFAGAKPVVVVENPYGGVIPELIDLLKVGKGYDLFRLSLYEAAALGANMSVPYGSWMGSVIQDSFYAPHDLCVEIQNFLAGHEALYSRKSCAETAVVYSVESEFLRAAGRSLFADNTLNTATSEIGPFWQVCETLSAAAQPYDVLFFPDGELRPDSLAPGDLEAYRTLILPDCRYLTQAQAGLLAAYLEAGGRLLVLGDLGTNLSEETRARILNQARVERTGAPAEFRAEQLPGGPQIRLHSPADLAINVQKTGAGAAIHILRYDYDPARDCVPALPELSLDVRLPEVFRQLDVHAPGQAPEVSLETSGDSHHLTLRDVPLYCVVLLK